MTLDRRLNPEPKGPFERADQFFYKTVKSISENVEPLGLGKHDQATLSYAIGTAATTQIVEPDILGMAGVAWLGSKILLDIQRPIDLEEKYFDYGAPSSKYIRVIFTIGGAIELLGGIMGAVKGMDTRDHIYRGLSMLGYTTGEYLSAANNE